MERMDLHNFADVRNVQAKESMDAWNNGCQEP